MRRALRFWTAFAALGGACSPRAPRPRWGTAPALALSGEKQAKT